MAARGEKENDTTRKLLLESTQKIVEAFQAGKTDIAQSAFSSFRRGLNHASGGRAGTAEALLSDLGPKDVIFRFLVDFYAQRRIFRKQIASVVAELLQIDSWLNALRAHKEAFKDLPDEFLTLLADREVEKKEQHVEEPLTPPREPEPPAVANAGTSVGPLMDPWQVVENKAPNQSENMDDSQQPDFGQEHISRKGRPRLSLVKSMMAKAAETSDTTLPIRANGPTVSGLAPEVRTEQRRKSRTSTIGTLGDFDSTIDILEEGCEMIRDLGFSAAEYDDASSAFETFRRGVHLVSNGSISKHDSDVVERMEPKGKILEFLVDMYEKHQKFRSRVTSTLTRLLAFDGWRGAADDDQSVRAVLDNFEDMRAVSIVSSVGTKLNLNTAAATAVSHGGIGALYVQIIAGYNLLAADSNGTSDPYVRVTLGKKTQRTPVICDTLNPTWNASPFVFEVPSLDAVISFEVLDSDFFKDDPLGDCDVRVSEVPMTAELSLVRRVLANVAHGEIELKLLLLPGKELHHVPRPWQSAPTTATVPESLEHVGNPQEMCIQEPVPNPQEQEQLINPQWNTEHLNIQAPTAGPQQQSTAPWTPWGAPPTVSPPPTTTPPTSSRARTQTNSNNPFGPAPEGELNLTPRRASEGSDAKSVQFSGTGVWSDQPVSPKFPSNPFSSKAPSTRQPSEGFSVSAPVTPRKPSSPFPFERDVSPRTPHLSGYPGAQAWKDPPGTTPNVSPRSACSKAPPVVAVRPTNPFLQGARTSFPAAKARNPFSQPPTPT